MGHEPRIVKPLGVFGPQSGQTLDSFRQRLVDLKGALDDDMRECVVSYLNGGTLIIALMKYTTDILEGKFGVSGGSAIMSDGTYYWRSDAVEYVRQYGIDVGAEGLQHMRSNNWIAPRMSDAEVLAVDRYLADALRRTP